jgi:hypothetical protein
MLTIDDEHRLTLWVSQLILLTALVAWKKNKTNLCGGIKKQNPE